MRTPRLRPDLVERQALLGDRVRALETRAHPWYEDPGGGVVTPWELVPPAPGWFSDSLAWRIQNDRVAFIGSAYVHLGVAHGDVVGTLPPRACPRVDQLVYWYRADGEVKRYVGTLSTAGVFTLPGVPDTPAAFPAMPHVIGDLNYPAVEVDS